MRLWEFRFACRWLTALVLTSALFPQNVYAQQPTPNDPDVDRYVSNLSSLYADYKAWDAERAHILQNIETIGQLKGRGSQSAKALADELDAISDLRSRAAKMGIYGQIESDLDTRSESAQAQGAVGRQLEAQVEAAVAFLPGDLRAIGEPLLTQWMKQELRLTRHRMRITRILQETPHALPTEQASILASMAGWPEVSQNTYWALMDSDLAWPKMQTTEGKTVEVNRYTYKTNFEGVDRTRAAKVLLGRLQSLQNAFGVLYTSRVEADLTIARYRKFSDGVNAMWFLRDAMPEGSLRIMADVARANLATLQRYMKLRVRALGLNRVDYGDLYIAPPAVDRRFPIAEVMKMAIDVAAPMGTAFQDHLRQRMEAGWMHLPPWPQKRDTYGIYPPVGGAKPYLIMSYRDDYASARTFAGSVIRMTAKADYPQDSLPDTTDDPAIFGNGGLEAAQTLYDDYLVDHAATRQEKITYLLYSLDSQAKGFFRWVLFSELDAKVEQLISAGKTPTGAQVSQMYLGLLHDYFGGTVVVDDVFAGEWMILSSVPFESYEHQGWPAASAAAACITEGLHAGDKNARQAVDGVYGGGDSDRSYYLLRRVGIDMATRAPYEMLFRRLNRQLDQLENQLGQEERVE
jgi:oligoendopeptidase F